VVVCKHKCAVGRREAPFGDARCFGFHGAPKLALTVAARAYMRVVVAAMRVRACICGRDKCWHGIRMVFARGLIVPRMCFVVVLRVGTARMCERAVVVRAGVPT